MKLHKPTRSENGLKHRLLTLFRIIRGLLRLVLLSTSFMLLIFIVPSTSVLLQLFSIHHSRKASSFLFGLWLSLWHVLLERLIKTKVIFFGECVPVGERINKIIGLYLLDVVVESCSGKGPCAYIGYILKSSLMKLHLFGWGFHIFVFIPAERKWEDDELILKRRLKTFTNP